MIRRVLIANRGEIAVRVIRACREMGIESVAVYSEVDARAPHALLADMAVPIGPAPSVESYLAIGKLLEAAKTTACDAVHPGYGFLAENSAFALACQQAGIVFIGPQPALIDLMGSKTAAREAARKAGLPIVPGATPVDQSNAAIRRAAEQAGFPVLLKAASGGGGKGMSLVTEASQLDEAIEAARRVAQAAFGDATLYVERAIERPRHVEIQVFGDSHGGAIHLFERDCSVQRRHQKVIEESPSPVLTPALRARMGEAAASLVRSVGYRNAGTVEFLFEGRGDRATFYFLEMNTRLQVEHPVTESVTGVDLVRAQILEAAGEPLPWTQAELTMRGHAIECRIYAEDPAADFMPQAGRLLSYREPVLPGVRIDSGVAPFSEVPVYYDPLLAKLIASGESRATAIERAMAALRDFPILGVRTNVSFLLDILDDARFREGAVHTRFLDEETDRILEAGRAAHPPDEAFAAAIAAEANPAEAGSHVRAASRNQNWDPASAGFPRAAVDPWTTLRGWRND